MNERCVCCGAEIPEGRQVCSLCTHKNENSETSRRPGKKKFSVNILTLLGVLLLLTALFLVMYNLIQNHNGNERAEKNAKKLESIMGESRESVPGESLTGELAEEEKVNPYRSMPEVESDGERYIGLLQIKALSLELPVISHWSYDALKTAPARYAGSVYQDNMVICAHNYSLHFGHLEDLEPGDSVYFTDMEGNRFAYQVAEIDILESGERDSMLLGDWDLTLFTCTVGGAFRLTVRCEKI